MFKVVVRIVVGVLIGVSLIAAALLGGVVWVVRQQFPQVEGLLQIEGLNGEVEIVRDRFGVPHIYADTAEDLFFAQGFVHAQDRFFQMEFWRRIGQGRLAELFGEGALMQDKFIRTLGWHRVAEQEVAMLDTDTRNVLESYSRGVNAYIARNADRLGLEFKVLGLIGREWSPEPWTPLNTLTWGKAMAFNLNASGEDELTRALLRARGGEALVNALMPPYPPEAPFIVASPTFGTAPMRTPAPAPDVSAVAQPLRALMRRTAQQIGLPRDPDVGSNNWVVSGARSTSGMPILANDPHLGVQMPSIWYQVGLHCRSLSAACPFDVVGASFAGTPGVIIGHNHRIAWGVTNVGPDVTDLFIEKPVEGQPDTFEFRGQPERAQVVEEVIRVAGRAEPVTLRVRITRHGPIINDVLESLADQPPLAMQWTALQPGQLLRSVIAINKATNWREFREALRYWDVPSQNFVYADVDGNIGYQMPGRVPIRAAGDGSGPVPGWTGEYEWVGEIPFDALPSVFNPPQGWIVTANHAVVDPSAYPFFLGKSWDHGYRARRIIQLLTAQDTLSVEDMQRIQSDTRSLFADDLLPLLLNRLPQEDVLSRAAFEQLRDWDRFSTRESVGALIFEALWVQLAHAIFDDELGDALAGEVISTDTATKLAVLDALRDPAAPWWDDVTTEATETPDLIIARAWRNALASLKARFGERVTDWQWGRAHVLSFRNQTLGRSGIAPIERLFNRGPFAVDGASSAVNNIGNAGPGFEATSLPSWRMVVDMADFTRAVAIHTTGQSGHAFHPHYDDMIPRWREGQYNPLLWTRDQVEAERAARLVLTP